MGLSRALPFAAAMMIAAFGCGESPPSDGEDAAGREDAGAPDGALDAGETDASPDATGADASVDADGPDAALDASEADAGADAQTCPPGFGGVDCATNLDDCAEGSCLNGGACVDGVNAFTCTCPSGYSGDRCETNTDDCEPSSCFGHGVCTDGVDAFSCTCDPGFKGTRCATSFATTTGDLSLHNDAELASICTVDELTLDGSLYIDGSVTSLEPLSCIRHVTGAVWVAYAHQLTSLHGLEGLETAGSLQIGENQQLASLAALQNVRTVADDIGIAYNPSLIEMTGLESLEDARSLTIAYNGALTAVPAFPKLVALEDLAFIDEPALTTLGGFPLLTSLNTLQMENIPLLEDVDALDALRGRVYRCEIINLDALEDLEGLSGLTTVQLLTVRDNARLSQWRVQAFFSGLFGVEGVGITPNGPCLPNPCSGGDACVEGVAPGTYTCTQCSLGQQDFDGDGTCAVACTGSASAGCGVGATCDDASGAMICTCPTDGALDCLHADRWRVFVDDDAAAGGDGASWETAYRSVQDAVDAISQVSSRSKVVLVKEGGYGTLTMAPYVRVLGGFPQALTGTQYDVDNRTGTSRLTKSVGECFQSDLREYLTSDPSGLAFCDAVSGPLVVGATGARLDGFDVSDGRLSGSSGAGIFLEEAHGMTLANLEVMGNVSWRSDDGGVGGGGIACASSTAVRIQTCSIHDNDALGGSAFGAGVSLVSCDVTIVDTQIFDNMAMALDANVAYSGRAGGGRASGGGLYASTANVVVSSVVVTGNEAQGGDAYTQLFPDNGRDGGDALGGGVHVAGGTLSVSDLHISWNVAVAGRAHDGASAVCGYCARESQPGSDNVMIYVDETTGPWYCAAPVYAEVGGDGGSGRGGGLYLSGGTLVSVSNVTVNSNAATSGLAGSGGDGASGCNCGAVGECPFPDEPTLPAAADGAAGTSHGGMFSTNVSGSTSGISQVGNTP